MGDNPSKNGKFMLGIKRPYHKQKLARLITQYRDIFFPIFRKARPSFFRVRMTTVFNVTSLKYGKYDITNEKIIITND